MTIQQQPDALSFSGNMKEIILSGVADSEVVFCLFTPASEAPLLERKYAPDSAGVISIDIHRFVDDRQSFLMSSETSPWQQPNLACTYYFTVGGLTSDCFTVVRGGVARLADTAANWLAQNFLTWQPTEKRVTYATPELLTYYAQQACSLIVKVYYPDGASETLPGISLSAGAWTIPVSFANVASRVVNLPGAYDVWIEDGQGNRLTYVQRYIADSKRENEQWILFENSLGGVDVFRAYGKGSMEAEHEHQIAESDDNLDEYRVDLKRLYRQSTGWLDKNQRRWLLDFFPARHRWILQDGAMLPIVLTDDTTTYTMDNMPAEFDFTFRYASAKPYLNIPRVEVPAAVMDITAPDMQSFTIPPRLVEFPRISPSEGGLIPIQHPYSEGWGTLSLEELLSIIAGNIHEATADMAGNFTVDNQHYLWVRQVVGGVPTLHKIKAESADLWDGIGFGEYIDQPVRRDDIVRFARVVAAIVGSPDFASGIETGHGWRIDEDGNGEMGTLTLRGPLKTPLLIYNKVRVTGGEMWNTEGGDIKDVNADPNSETAFILTMDVEEGDTIELEVDDICKGKYSYHGHDIYSYFRVTHVDQAAKTIRIVLGADSAVPGGQNHAPVPFMTVARYGNFTVPERQRSQYFSSTEGRIIMLTGVDQYIIEPRNYAVVIGSLPDALIPNGLPQLQDRPSIYLENVLVRNMIKLDRQGSIIKTIRDRGLWSALAAQQDPYLCDSEYQDECYHKSCKYRCLVEGTLQEPRYDSTDWLLVAGDTTLKLEIESSAGVVFVQGILDTILVATLFRGVNDISDEILDADWTWTRETSDVASDRIWDADHASCTRELHLTNEDLPAPLIHGRFVCTAYVRDGVTNVPPRAYVDF